MVLTILCASCSALSAAYIKPHISGTYKSNRKYDSLALCNGLIAGCVSIAGVVDRVEPWAACLIGLFTGLFYSVACWVCRIWNVDDPVERCAVHGFSGMWGLVSVGIFDNQFGLVSDFTDKGRYFWYQFLGMLIILVWTMTLTALYFCLLSRCNVARVNLIDEVMGLDSSLIGEEIFDTI